jgi:hypothetical protein
MTFWDYMIHISPRPLVGVGVPLKSSDLIETQFLEVSKRYLVDLMSLKCDFLEHVTYVSGAYWLPEG